MGGPWAARGRKKSPETVLMEAAAATSWLDSEPPRSAATCLSDLQPPASEWGGAAESRADLSGRASPRQREAARRCTSRNRPVPPSPGRPTEGTSRPSWH